MRSKGAFRKAFLLEFIKQLSMHHALMKDLHPEWHVHEEVIAPPQIVTPVEPEVNQGEQPIEAQEIQENQETSEQQRTTTAQHAMDAQEDPNAHDVRSIEMEDTEHTTEKEPTQEQIQEISEYETSEEVGETPGKRPAQQEMPPAPDPNERVIAMQEPSRLGKIEALLADKEITAIECTGPDQPIQLVKNKQLTNLNETLTQQELQDIIQGLSDNMQIPIENQILSGENQQFIVTAVLSEFAGNRLVIHKK